MKIETTVRVPKYTTIDKIRHALARFPNNAAVEVRIDSLYIEFDDDSKFEQPPSVSYTETDLLHFK